MSNIYLLSISTKVVQVEIFDEKKTISNAGQINFTNQINVMEFFYPNSLIYVLENWTHGRYGELCTRRVILYFMFQPHTPTNMFVPCAWILNA